MLIRLLPSPAIPHLAKIPIFNPFHRHPLFTHLRLNSQPLVPITRAKSTRRPKTPTEPHEAQPIDAEFVEYGEATEDVPFPNGFRGREDEEEGSSSGYRGRQEERDYDKDPEFAEILGSCFDDPTKAQSRVEERIRKKRSKILHTKTGTAAPMKVIFNKFGFSNSYIWFEFYNAPLAKDISLICDTIRSWHIIGRLGGCNSMNMQEKSLTRKEYLYNRKS